jgi:uncharacterized protein (TIGR00369 family)
MRQSDEMQDGQDLLPAPKQALMVWQGLRRGPSKHGHRVIGSRHWGEMIMSANAIDVSRLGTARSGFETASENWPPNVKAAHGKPSPTSAHLGLEILAVNQADGIVEMAFNADDKLCNKWGGIQGGNVAAMLDDAMAFAIGLNLDWGQISPTLELKVSMLAPARPGRLYAVGQVVRRGRSVGFVEGQLYDEAGQLLATGSSTANFVTLKKPDKKREKK